MISTNRSPWIDRAARLAGCVLANVALTNVARAQATQFNPEVAVGIQHTDNVQFVSSDGTTFPDWIGNLQAVLPVEHKWSTGSLTFVYTPTYVKHDTYTNLDRLDQNIDFELQATPSRTSTITANALWTKSQDQGKADSTNSPDFYLSTRTNRQIFGGSLSAEFQFERKWSGTFETSLSREQYTAIPDFATTTSTANVENRNTLRAGFRVARDVSAKDAVGFGYVWTRFDLAYGDTETVHAVGLTWDRTLARDTTLAVRLGPFLRVDDFQSGTVSATASDYGLAATMEFTKMIRRSSLHVDAGYKPSSGGSLTGTSTDATIGFGFSGDTSPDWPWSLAARWARRDPTDPLDATLTATSVGGSVEWRPRGKKFGLIAYASWVDQAGGGLGEPAGQFLTAGTALIWYPLGAAVARRR